MPIDNYTTITIRKEFYSDIKEYVKNHPEQITTVPEALRMAWFFFKKSEEKISKKQKI